MGEVRGMVLLPRTRANGEVARERTVPETVMAGAPGMSVWLPMMYAEALLANMVAPAIVSGGAPGVGAAAKGIVVPPMTMSDANGARLMGVPEISMAGAPGMSVWLPILYAEALFGRKVSPAMITAGPEGVTAAARGIVVPPMTIFDADGARLKGVPEIVMAGEPGANV